jgi:hypothetical protein
MAGEEKGIKETKEALVAMGALAVVARLAYREAGGDVTKFATGVGFSLLANPAAMEAVKAGFNGAGEITGEVKDLSWSEVLELGETAIGVTRKSFTEVQ